MIELGFHTDNWRPLGESFEHAVECGASLGLRHVEFAVIHGQDFIQALGYDPAVSLQENPRKVRRLLESRELTVSQIDAAYPLMGPKASAFGVAYVQQAIGFAAELGRPSVDTTDGGFEIKGDSREEVFRITCENCRQCLSWAGDDGVVLAVEPHGPYTNDPDFLERLLSYFESPSVRFNLDTGNTYIAGRDPLAFCQRFRKYLVHGHVKDVSDFLASAARGEDTGIGTSYVPVGGGVNAQNIRRIRTYLSETA